MKRIHKKTLPKYFEDVRMGAKSFELRKDEDSVEPGDELCLEEWDETAYTGRKVIKKVSYVLRNVPEFGLMDGYCIIGWRY